MRVHPNNLREPPDRHRRRASRRGSCQSMNAAYIRFFMFGFLWISSPADYTASVSQAPRTLGLERRKRDHTACGLCGVVTTLTKTHVPPQCADNTASKVRRVRLIVGNGPARRSYPRDGGLYTYGLCRGCNGLQAKYDPAYCVLAKSLRPLWSRDWRTIIKRAVLPLDEVLPGDVARSVLIGFYGVNPNLRTIHSDLTGQLLAEDPQITPPADLRLRLALTRGTAALLTGPTAGFLHNLRAPGGGAYGFANLAQVYLPPLAWQLTGPHMDSTLTPSDTPSLLDLQGWSDVTSWLAEPLGSPKKLREACRSLPLVAHPRQDPAHAESWIEMLGDTTEILESPEVSDSILR